MTPSRRRSTLLALVLIAAGAALVVAGARGWRQVAQDVFARPTATPTVLTATPAPTLTASVVPTPTSSPAPTLTEPILPPPPTLTRRATTPAPTLTATPTASPATASATSAPTHTPNAAASQVAATTPAATATRPPATATLQPTALPPTASPSVSLYTLRQRLGVCGLVGRAQDAAERLGFGWYLNWQVTGGGSKPPGVDYMPMIRLMDGQIRPDGDALLAIVDALPGAVWLIGNEPDVKWQDNVTAEAYVQAYHHLYTLLKGRDPTCQVAIGGVSQPTPLRMRYLERILDLYQERYGQPMPVDVWNVHNFILREERDSWGVDIPPGMPDRTGRLREIADHDDLAIFQQQIVDFRQWMADHGQRNKPLIVTEYGILMPAEYGFPVDRVKRFMLGSFEYLRTAIDPALGHPSDGGRLVQRWCWYSMADTRYPTGNLVEAGSGELTALGQAFRDYARSEP